MTRRYAALACAAAALLVALPGAAQDKPNFSGTWKLNAAKSDYGPIPAPEKLQRTIKHSDPDLNISTTQTGQQGESTTELVYTTDGKPVTNKTPRGEVTGNAKWDGNVLVIASKREMQGAEITTNERWTLSEDGKMLTIVIKINAPQGDFEIKTVLDKQ